MQTPNESGGGDNRAGTSLTLLARAKASEAGAWDRLVSMYTPLVGYWCRTAGLRPEDKDDVVQEVFLAAATGLPQFHRDQPGDTFRGWLRGITRNTLLAYFRRHAREPVGEGGTEAQRRIQDLAVDLPEDDPPEQSRGIYHRALEMVRCEFEERTWQMFWQVAVEDLSVDEVAERFGVTKAAVRKAKSRVLFRLKQEVGDILE